jgi:hypothetical protein
MFVRLEQSFFLKFNQIKEIIPYTYEYKSNYLEQYVKKDYLIDLTSLMHKKKNIIKTKSGYYIMTGFSKKYIEQSILKK